MSEPSPDSPFAEFATEKPNALEYLRARQEEDQQSRAESWLLLAILLSAASSGAAIGAAVAAGLMTFPVALALALAGSVAGLLGGWLMGMITWASIITRARGFVPGAPVDPLAADLVHGNKWNRMTIWLSIWGALGIGVGAAVAASESGNVIAAIKAGDTAPACWSGSAVGLAGGFIVWFVFRLLRPRRGA